MATTGAEPGYDDRALGRSLAMLFPGYAGDRHSLLRTLTEEDLDQAFRRIALESHPDRLGGRPPELARLARDRFLRSRAAYDALRSHVRASRPTGDGAPGARPEVAAPTSPTLIAVGGAKGGIGKSTLSASVAAALSMLGHRVVAVDMDLGGADLHLFLGVRQPRRTLAHLWSGEASNLDELVEPTGTTGLSLLAGDSSCLGSANVRHAQKQKLLRRLRGLAAEFVVLDLGGDTTYNTLDFFLLADHRLVVTTADPAAVLDGYNFIKVSLLRALLQWAGDRATQASAAPEARARLERFTVASGRPGAPSPAELVHQLAEVDPATAAAARETLARFRPKLILNLADPSSGPEVIERIRDVCRQHLAIDVELCHLVPADPRVAQATRRLGNVIAHQHDGAAAQAVWALAHKLAAPARPPGPGAPPGPGGRPTIHTRFFQPPWLFPLLSRLLEERAARAAVSHQPLAGWVVGCGGGEAVYSLAIALDETGRRTRPFPYHVWGTGASAEEAERARRGVYPQVFVAGLRGETLTRHFLRGTGLSAGSVALKDGLRQRVSVLEGPAHQPPSTDQPMDVVLVNLPVETVAALLAGPLGVRLLARLGSGGLLAVPTWLSPAPPVSGLTPVEEGVFRCSGPA